MAFDLGAVVAHVKADVSNFQQGMATAKQERGGFQNTIAKVGDGLANFGKQAAIMAGVVGAGVLAAGKVGIESAAKFEQYQVAFTTLLKSQEKAAAAIKAIELDAKATPFELAPLVAGNQRLISAGVNAADARLHIIALGNAISATGGGTAELERLSTNLQQIKAVGKASAMDIKQFAFAGINVYQMLADSTGKSVEQVRDLDITYDMLIKSFEKASEKGGMFEDAMAKQSVTLNGLMSTLKDTISLGLKDIMMKSGLFDVIRNMVAALIPFLEATAVKLVDFFQRVGAAISFLMAFFQTGSEEALFNFFNSLVPDDDTAAAITTFFTGFMNILREIAIWIGENQELVMTFFQGLAIAIGALIIIGTITALITALMNPLVLVALAIAALYTAWQTNFLGIRDITEQVVNAIMIFFNEVLMPLFQIFVDWFTERWTFISTMIQGAWEIIKGIVQVAWAAVYAILAVGIALLTGDWQKAWERIKDALRIAWDGIKNIFNGIIDFIKGWGGMLISELVRPFREAWDRIQEYVNKIKDALDFTKRHSPSVVDIVRTGVNKVNKAMEGLEFSTTLAPRVAGLAVSNGGQSTQINDIHISLPGALIADEYSAGRIAEIIGNQIVKKVQGNVRF